MKVLKFGGTSVGSAQRIKNVAELIVARGKNIIVLSAMSGTTNTLLEICDYLSKGNVSGAMEVINQLESKYSQVISELYSNKNSIKAAQDKIGVIFKHLRSLATEPYSTKIEKEIVGQGEMMSTNLMVTYLEEKGVNAKMLPALDFMKINSAGEPDNGYIKANLYPLLEKYADADIYITQGFICRNSEDEMDNLQRGGSDYTASLIGAAIDAEEIEIWTDIDGMHNNDPRFVSDTAPVAELHFEEAAELAYFGAKILHPTCVLPAKLNNIPVRLLNTMQPEAHGTVIYNCAANHCIKAVAAKDNITALKIKSSRMLLAHGFLRRVFEVFETYKTPIDMITTSEVGVSVTIDNTLHLHNILDELKKLGTVTVDSDMTIICVVGDLEWHNCGFETKVLDAMGDIPVRMISYGGSNYNISILVKSSDKIRALNSLQNYLFK